MNQSGVHKYVFGRIVTMKLNFFKKKKQGTRLSVRIHVLVLFMSDFVNYTNKISKSTTKWAYKKSENNVNAHSYHDRGVSL